MGSQWDSGAWGPKCTKSPSALHCNTPGAQHSHQQSPSAVAAGHLATCPPRVRLGDWGATVTVHTLSPPSCSLQCLVDRGFWSFLRTVDTFPVEIMTFSVSHDALHNASGKGREKEKANRAWEPAPLCQQPGQVLSVYPGVASPGLDSQPPCSLLQSEARRLG